MKLETIEKLCCPFDKSGLTLRPITGDEQDNILEGLLICLKCDRVYPIISGIPIMSPDEYRDFKIEQPTLESWSRYLNSDENERMQIADGKLKEQAKVEKEKN